MNYSIFDPRLNLHEVCEQMILLEDHLCNPQHWCPDCVSKHIMSISAWAKEATTLDKTGQLQKLCYGLAGIAKFCWDCLFVHGFHPSMLTMTFPQQDRDRVLRTCTMQDVRKARKLLLGMLRGQLSANPAMKQLPCGCGWQR